ncbi:MAG: DegT/DnrJ/EryC1/StrS family aminotransferase [Vallitalea sp.]|nr:DegT/DnrJ/EryC1/StrS family aminotransferase [Vallitalea sp.]
MKKKIYVTQPFLPPLNEYIKYLEEIWDCGILTHNGPLVQKLEKELIKRLQVNNLIATSNATMALQLAIKALNLKGEIITTPFTYIATIAAINWEKCTPIFVDIDEETFNIDSTKIEEKITKKTSAILGVHTFSNPCNIEAIEKIAKDNKLKVIYDSAHGMFVNYKNKSLLEYGDISIVSFHATKLFNTVEGGACITESDILAEKIKSYRFFGFNEKKDIVTHGTNAKMTEVHAAMGLATLKYMDEVRKSRREKYELYKKLLSSNENVKFQKINEESHNYSYMPVLFKSENILKQVLKILNDNNIFPRRYFYPSLNKVKVISTYEDNLEKAEDIATRILCLPLYNKLKTEDIEIICYLINQIAYRDS